MPRVKLQGNKEEKLLKGNVMKYKTMNEVSVSEIAVLLGISNRCVYNRLNNPEEFRIKELRKLANRFDISIIDLLSEK